VKANRIGVCAWQVWRHFGGDGATTVFAPSAISAKESSEAFGYFATCNGVWRRDAQ
jgi:hypothetical protein